MTQEAIDHLLACEELILELHNLPMWAIGTLPSATRLRLHLSYKAILNRRGVPTHIINEILR